MSGNICCSPVHAVIRVHWATAWGKPNTYSVEISKSLKKEDTHVVIFGPSQAEEQKCFEKQFKGKILYKGKKAVNSSPGHGINPRNTIFIFELE